MNRSDNGVSMMEFEDFTVSRDIIEGFDVSKKDTADIYSLTSAFIFVHRTVANYIVWKVVQATVSHLSDAVFRDIKQRYKHVSGLSQSKE